MKIIKDIEHLHKFCVNIGYKESKGIANKMILWLLGDKNISKDTLGLACNQLGLDGRVIAMKLANDKWKTFINPIIVNSSDEKITTEESCLSVSKSFDIKRSVKIKITDDRSNHNNPNDNTTEYSGMNAIVIQHEIDHLNGILISDIGRI